MKLAKNYSVKRLASLIAVLVSGLAHGQQNTLPTVEVSATRQQSDLDPDGFRNPFRLPTSNRAGTETFSAEDIKNLQPKDLFDLLDKATGMTITYQGRKNPFFVKERGGGTFTYIIDGAILPTVTQRILQRIPLAAIEELQVVRDSTALALAPLIAIGASGSGSGLNTGFIIIRTRQPRKDEVSLSASVEKAVSQPTARKENLFAGKHFSDNEDKDGLNGYVAGFISDFQRPSRDDWFDGQNGEAYLLKGGVGNGLFSVNLTGFYESGRFEMQRGISPLNGALDNSKWYYDPAETGLTVLSGTIDWNANQTTLFSAFGTQFHQMEIDASFASSAPVTPSFYDENTSGVSLRHNARFGNTFINLGAQTTHSWALGSSGPTPNTKWDSTVTGYSLSLEQRLFDNRLFFDGGYRQDYKHVNTADTTTRMQNVDLPPASAFSLGSRWLINPMFVLNGRYFEGTQGNSGGDFTLKPQPGTTLDPESQRRWEVAVEGKFLPVFNAAATWFNVNIKNQKSQSTTAYTFNGSQYYYYTQSDNQRTGFELLFRGYFATHSSYKASWTHLTKNISSNASVAGTNANNLYDLTLSHAWSAYTANFSVKRIDSYLGSNLANSGTPAVQIGGYTRVDANLIRDFRWLGVDWSALLYGRNLTNQHYVTQQGPTGLYPDRGRTIGVELRAEY